MTEWDKLREGNDLAARLLRAGSREQPRSAVRSRAERALGLSAVAASAALTSTASATVTATGMGPSAPFGVALFAKWLAVGVLAGGTAAGGVTAVHRALEPVKAPAGVAPRALSVRRAPNTSATSLPLLHASPDARAISAGTSPDRKPEVASRGIDAPRALGGPDEHRASAHAPEPSDDSPRATADALALSREVELLERVRAKLRAGNSGAALAELDAVGGNIRTLIMEADLLRVEALLAHGERARAEALAAELERRDPRGGQSFRLKRLFGRP